jgi:hypothetical protein
MRSAPVWEQIGAGLSLPFSGVHVIDATKQFYRRAPLRATRRSFALRPVLLPQPAPTPRTLNPPDGGVSRRLAPALRPDRTPNQ